MAHIDLPTRDRGVSAQVESRIGYDWLRLTIGDDEVTLFSGALSPDQLRRIADIVNEPPRAEMLESYQEEAA